MITITTSLAARVARSYPKLPVRPCLGPGTRPLRRHHGAVRYLGKSTAFEDALADFSEAYAYQNERDHATLVAAVRIGVLGPPSGRLAGSQIPRLQTERTLVAHDKGVLATDESDPTCNERFAALGIPQTLEAWRAYRELIVTTLGLGECISDAILCDETIRQQKKDGTPFLKIITAAGIIPGIKVDSGENDMAGHAGEKITEGLDGLRDRLAEYFQMGARSCRTANPLNWHRPV